jgi:DNA-3-methyladenine glycosylase II
MAQQLSVHAARAIIDRLDDATGCDPIRFAALSDSALRSVGLIPQKITYGRELARAVTSGVLNFRKIYRLRGDDVIAALTEVKGIALDGRNLLNLCAGPARRHACR